MLIRPQNDVISTLEMKYSIKIRIKQMINQYARTHKGDLSFFLKIIYLEMYAVQKCQLWKYTIKAWILKLLSNAVLSVC